MLLDAEMPSRIDRCVLCGAEPIAVFWAPGGCTALPTARLQPLCLHHAVRARPLAGMYLLLDLTDGARPLWPPVPWGEMD